MSINVTKAIAHLAAERDDLAERVAALDAAIEQLSGLGTGTVNPPTATPAPSPEPPTKAKKGTPRPTGGHQCSECDRSFNRPAGLTRHLRETHGIGKRTKAADRKERERNRRAEELEDEQPEPEPEPLPRSAGHTCEVCGTTFLTRGSLAAHRHREDHYLEDETA